MLRQPILKVFPNDCIKFQIIPTKVHILVILHIKICTFNHLFCFCFLQMHKVTFTQNQIPVLNSEVNCGIICRGISDNSTILIFFFLFSTLLYQPCLHLSYQIEPYITVFYAQKISRLFQSGDFVLFYSTALVNALQFIFQTIKLLLRPLRPFSFS